MACAVTHKQLIHDLHITYLQITVTGLSGNFSRKNEALIFYVSGTPKRDLVDGHAFHRMTDNTWTGPVRT